MKKRPSRIFIILPLIIILLFIGVSSVMAHGGGTDSNGGHYDHSTGEYHYHHGSPPHQHIDGYCPYDFVDNTGDNSGPGSSGERSGSASSSKASNTSSPKGGISRNIVWIALVLLMVLPVPIPYIVNKSAENRYSSSKDKHITPNTQNNTTANKRFGSTTPTSGKPPKCPRCGAIMVKRTGKYGQFYGCSNFPRCRATRSISR